MNAASARRLQDLRAAHIADLPTPRRRAWYRLLAVGCSAAAVFTAYDALTERAWTAVLAAAFAVAAFGYVVAAREVTAQLRSPPTAAFDELGPLEEGAVQTFDTAAQVSVGGGAALLEGAVGLAGERVTRRWRQRAKPKRLAHWAAATTADLRPGEEVLVQCHATLMRWLPPWHVRYGWLTVTGGRVLFHRRPGRLHLSAPLEDVEVREWHVGQYAHAHHHVLVLRVAGGRPVRFLLPQAWADEAQLAFELIASCSARPPAFLAARWAAADPGTAGSSPAASPGGPAGHGPAG